MSKLAVLNKVCRGSIMYEKARFIVPDHKADWKVYYPAYDPPTYSMPGLSEKPWADPDIGAEGFEPKWNAIDVINGERISRESYVGKQKREYKVEDGYPINPIGRTGLRGRGKLGRWGPNHAADAIVTRWKRGEDGAILKDPLLDTPTLQFISILRSDCEEWAIPGGFVNPNEIISDAVQREFLEEALNSGDMSERDKARLKSRITMFFAKGIQIYRGYVDDPRNTDNAWIETLAMNFHDESGSIVDKLNLRSGDDAADVKWMDFDRHMQLYASHFDIVEKAAHHHGVLF